MKPRTALWVVATQVSTTAKAGAPHGAATMPEVAPNKSTAGYEPPPRLPAHAARRAGTRLRPVVDARECAGGNRDHRPDAGIGARHDTGGEEERHRHERAVLQGVR